MSASTLSETVTSLLLSSVLACIGAALSFISLCVLIKTFHENHIPSLSFKVFSVIPIILSLSFYAIFILGNNSYLLPSFHRKYNLSENYCSSLWTIQNTIFHLNKISIWIFCLLRLSVFFKSTPSQLSIKQFY